MRDEFCPEAHEGGPVKLVKYCPACRGGARSKKKAAAVRENGKRGGRPRKNAPRRRTEVTR